MEGKKLIFAVSQSSIQHRKFFSAGRGPHVHNCGYSAHLPNDFRNDLVTTVDLPGKSDVLG